ncbi:hypothetical protein [Variovorax paradoxus]|uniref:hypothetical protein n=1 Tax=Variovorax paradoxus TaxID=34073 RepID=UPI0038CF5828
MTAFWPWLAVAGLGAFHGLSPANGWMFAAAWGVRARDAGRARRALLPIAVGHFASVAIVAFVVAQGLWLERALVQVLAGALLLFAAVYRLLRGGRFTIGSRASHAGLAGWSFVMATAHGAGLMLVPALVPLCLTGDPARAITASGSMALALAGCGAHGGDAAGHGADRDRRVPRHRAAPAVARRAGAEARVDRGAGGYRLADDRAALRGENPLGQQVHDCNRDASTFE